MFYMVDPNVIEQENKRRKVSFEKFEEYKLEKHDTNKYKIIIINNSQNTTSYGDLISKSKDFLNEYVKIYLHTLEGIKFIIGPIFIDDTNKINNIVHYMINSIKSDYYSEYGDIIYENIKNYFINDENQRFLF